MQKFAEVERALGLDLVATEIRGPTAGDMAAAAEMTQEERYDMIDGMVAGLAARLEEQPNDPDGWIMLVRSYATIGKQDIARSALDQAQAVFKDNEGVPQVLDAQAAALVQPE